MASLIHDEGFATAMNARSNTHANIPLDYFVSANYNKNVCMKLTRRRKGLSWRNPLTLAMGKQHGFPLSFNIDGMSNPSPLHKVENVAKLESYLNIKYHNARLLAMF